jgi:hypothetical protein
MDFLTHLLAGAGVVCTLIGMHQVNDWQVSEWDDELIEDHYFKVAFEQYIKMINEWQDEKNS